jgi:DNA mismatch endonuclease (patch repair protein)
LNCRADIVFRKAKVAVFVDGCFWHVCPRHSSWPKNNKSWWSKKLLANVERDRRVTRILSTMGWTVVRIWEHESPETGMAAIQHALKGSSHCHFGPLAPA